MKMNKEGFVASDETIVRLLHREWVVDGVLQQTAFELRNGETYISVNRPAVETFDDDVRDFISTHPSYKVAPFSHDYNRAKLLVSEVRDIKVEFGSERVDIEVAVEPRASHVKSHAGIFVHLEGKNIKGGQKTSVAVRDGRVISSAAILQKVRWTLLRLAQVESSSLQESQ